MHDDSPTLALARHYVEVDRPQAAIEALDGAREDELEEPEYWLLRAHALYDLGLYHDSAEAAKTGLGRDPEDLDLLNMLALCQMELGQADAAEATNETALALSPDNEVLLANRALILARRKHFRGARAAIDEAMRVAPQAVVVLRIRAQVAILADDEQAGAYVDELLALAPDDRIGHALKGNLAAQRKRYVSAARAFDEAARLDPSDVELVSVAREARVAAHPLAAPLRPLWRLGRWRAYGIFLVVSIGLAALGFNAAHTVIVVGWLVIVALSWLGPPFVRWWERRKYGGF